MRIILLAGAMAVLSLGVDQTSAKVVVPSDPILSVAEHGGGCRKSSPPGQCCHMDNSTGRVHCH